MKKQSNRNQFGIILSLRQSSIRFIYSSIPSSYSTETKTSLYTYITNCSGHQLGAWWWAYCMSVGPRLSVTRTSTSYTQIHRDTHHKCSMFFSVHSFTNVVGGCVRASVWNIRLCQRPNWNVSVTAALFTLSTPPGSESLSKTKENSPRGGLSRIVINLNCCHEKKKVKQSKSSTQMELDTDFMHFFVDNM